MMMPSSDLTNDYNNISSVTAEGSRFLVKGSINTVLYKDSDNSVTVPIFGHYSLYIQLPS